MFIMLIKYVFWSQTKFKGNSYALFIQYGEIFIESEEIVHTFNLLVCYIQNEFAGSDMLLNISDTVCWSEVSKRLPSSQ